MASPFDFVGLNLGDYEVGNQLGEGAFGFVYEAVHLPSRTIVALKLLKPGAGLEQIREFDNEADLLVKLSGAGHVVNLLDSLTSDIAVTLPGGGRTTLQIRFHVLERADGCLDQLLSNLNTIPWRERLSLYRDIVLGVHQMHHCSVVHRDLKCSNCLLFASVRGRILVKINDLGRSRDLNSTPGASPVHYQWGRGDPNFFPPEMVWQLGSDESQCHRRADLYGLGSILVELAIGQGITALTLYPRAPIIQADLVLPRDDRFKQYSGRLDEIRSWYESVYDVIEPGIPSAIRQQSIELIRQLCDPDPLARLPKIGPGRRLASSPDLGWLIRRVDILIKTLSNAERQAQQLYKKKVSRANT